jgi:hypothetical protein
MNFKDSNTLQIGISSETSPHSNRTQQRPGSWVATTTTSWGQILPWSSSCSSETVSDGAILLFFSSLLLCNYLSILDQDLLFLLLHGGRELGFWGGGLRSPRPWEKLEISCTITWVPDWFFESIGFLSICCSGNHVIPSDMSFPYGWFCCRTLLQQNCHVTDRRD